jgi:hypothetical protein
MLRDEFSVNGVGTYPIPIDIIAAQKAQSSIVQTYSEGIRRLPALDLLKVQAWMGWILTK